MPDTIRKGSESDDQRRGVPVLSLVLPGLPQILAGRWAAGVTALLIWLGMLSIVITRFGRIRDAIGGGGDEKLAVATLLAGLVTSWLWSWRDMQRAVDPAPIVATQWHLASSAFSRNRTAVLGLMVIIGLYVIALITPLIAPHDPTVQYDLVTLRLARMSAVHPLGTDQLSRDVLSRLLYGARISLTIGLLAVTIAVTIGTLLGAVAGYLGGWTDTVIMRCVDMVMSFPRLILLITAIAVFQPSLGLIVIVLGLTLWPGTARIVRGEVLSLREREFVEATVALGYSKRRIITRHLIPNALAPVIVAATLGIGTSTPGGSRPSPAWRSF